jgi:hypothetical protein
MTKLHLTVSALSALIGPCFALVAPDRNDVQRSNVSQAAMMPVDIDQRVCHMREVAPFFSSDVRFPPTADIERLS